MDGRCQSPLRDQREEKIEQDAPEILDHVKQGKLSIPQAKKVAALPVEQRSAAIKRVRKHAPAEEGGLLYRDSALAAGHRVRRVTLRPRRAKARQFPSVIRGVWLRRFRRRI
jgi:hypothetical protein